MTTVNRKEFLAALGLCAAVVAKKSPMPMLNSVLVTLGDRSFIAGTDLVTSVEHDIQANVSSAASFACDAKALVERVRTIQTESVRLEPTDAGLKVSSVGGSRTFVLPTMQGEFPLLPQPESQAWLSVASKEIHSGIAAVEAAISDDDTRSHMSAALIEVSSDGAATFVATDGHRVHVRKSSLPSLAGMKALIPRRGAAELRAICEGFDGDIELQVDKARLFVRRPGVLWSVLTVDATFAPYQQVIPAVTNKRVAVERDALLSAIRAVRLASSESGRGIRFNFQSEIHLDASKDSSGSASDTVPCEYDGAHVETGISANYMEEALAVVGERALIQVTGPLDPVLVLSEDTMTLAVIMPMRL